MYIENLVVFFQMNALVMCAVWLMVAFLAALGSAQVDFPIPEDETPLVSGEPIDAACITGDLVPADLISCGSCEERCGSTSDPDSVDTLGSKGGCACDAACGYHNDCCSDFQQFCPKEFQDFGNSSRTHAPTFSPEDFRCVSFSTSLGESFNSLVVFSCPDGTECQHSSQLNEDVNTFVPMFDPNRGVHFISGHCAVCNGITEVQPWKVTLFCAPVFGPQEFKETGVVNDTETLSEVVGIRSCHLVYWKHQNSRPCRHGVISSCPDSCENQNLVKQCKSGTQDLLRYKKEPWVNTDSTERVYRNPSCAVCNAAQNSTTSGLVCAVFTRNFEVNRFIPHQPGSFSLTLVFDFNPRRGLTVGRHTIPECDPGEVYVPNEDACRPILCRTGFVLDGSDCIPEPVNITTVVKGTLSSWAAVQDLDVSELKKDQLKEELHESFSVLLATHGIPISGDVSVHSEVRRTEDGLLVSSNFECNCDYSSLFQKANNNTDNARKFEEAIAMEVREKVVQHLMNENIRLEAVSTNVQSHLTRFFASGSEGPTSDCTWLVYQANETEFVNGSVTVIATRRTYSSGEYQILEQAVIVCETDFNFEEEPSRAETALGLLTLVCVGLSIVCLIARVILQCFVSSFQNKPGRLHLQLTLALLLAFVVLIIGPFVSDMQGVCIGAAAVLAYGFLAAFVWMNVIAVDTWLVFKASSAFSRAEEMGKSFILYLCIGWGLPVLLVAVSIITHFVDSVNVNFSPQFGGSRCWYTQRYAMLLYFGVPIAISILLNTGIYIHTSVNLHRAFKNRVAAANADKYQQNFGVYVRLFVLMGITWVFGFISAFTDQIVIDFIFVILTSLQGVFLFISFVLTKRVLNELRYKVREQSGWSSSQGKATKSTPLPSQNTSSL